MLRYFVKRLGRHLTTLLLASFLLYILFTVYASTLPDPARAKTGPCIPTSVITGDMGDV